MELFQSQRSLPRWASFENPAAARGAGGRENRGAKGHPSDSLDPGQSRTLLDWRGPGIIRRIWMTVNDRSPEMLRGLRIDMVWDGATRPAVSVPLGDFFGVGLGRRTAFECDLFSDPEGRSFNCAIPMPFRESARVTLTNEMAVRCSHVFYDINLESLESPAEGALYFHTHWRRDRAGVLGDDYLILPQVRGSGRFLGSNVGVMTDPRYGDAWWGEGEVKIFLDDDGEYPTLVGTGTEDYIGTAWGQGRFAHRFQGCPVADAANRQWTFYRYHIPDPVHFRSACRVAIQRMGGTTKDEVIRLGAAGAPLIPVSFDSGEGSIGLFESTPARQIDDPTLPAGWCNFFRLDDWSSTAYFYLDAPENELEPLPACGERTAGLLKAEESGDTA